MGKIKQGILGGFNGTTGSVVGASWKGIAYMRGKAQSIKNPRTEKQQENRSLFGRVSDVMSRANAVCRLGFLSKAVKKSPFNVAVQENVDFVNESGEDFSLDTLIFSSGGMIPLSSGSVELVGSDLRFTATVIVPPSEATDVCVVAVYQGEDASLPIIDYRLAKISPHEQTCEVSFVPFTTVTYRKIAFYAFTYDVVNRDASASRLFASYTPA